MKFYLLIFSLIMIAQHALATTENIEDFIAETAKREKFNGSIIIEKSGQIIVKKHIGFADNQQKISLKDFHQFSPGSVGKEFTAVSIMQLVEQGKISYQDKITQYIDKLPAGANQITIEHLMAHTSGFPRIKWKKGINTVDVEQQIEATELQFEPGTKYLYSNVNVVLRAKIVERVSHSSYHEYLQNNIFIPAGMSNSYQQTEISHRSDNVVAGDYLTFISGVTIYVSPLDLLRFEKALVQGKLVSLTNLKQVLPGDSLSGKSNRAYFDFGTFYLNDVGELIRWYHDGSNPSHHTIKYHDFENDVTMIAMSSDGNKSTLYQLMHKVVEVTSQPN